MGHVVRTELRAFPRFACSTPARLVAGDIDEDGQVIDLSREGCKMLPFRLAPLIEAGLMAGAMVILHIGGSARGATLAWATPNRSALGCRFTEPCSDADLRRLAEAAPSPAALPSEYLASPARPPY